MKKIPLFLLALLATLLCGFGAHSLANHVDPTSRGDRVAAAATSTSPDGGTQPCMACNYQEV